MTHWGLSSHHPTNDGVCDTSFSAKHFRRVGLQGSLQRLRTSRWVGSAAAYLQRNRWLWGTAASSLLLLGRVLGASARTISGCGRLRGGGGGALRASLWQLLLLLVAVLLASMAACTFTPTQPYAHTVGSQKAAATATAVCT